jgi:heme exporter protein B
MINSITALIRREFKINYKNFSDILSILLFFLLSVLIFIFAIGPDKDIFNKISIGIIWALILLTNTLSLKKFFQSDFDDNSIILFHMGGLSYEIIVIIKLIINWICFQIPFLFIIAIGCVFLNIEFTSFNFILISFLLGSPIITCITAISGSINLLNKKNFAIGSLIIMIFSIPVIIFAVNLNNGSDDIIKAQINILLGIMLFFLSITPWICAICIKLGLQNK